MLAVEVFQRRNIALLSSLSKLSYKTLQLGVLFLAAGIIFGSIYMLWMVQRVFWNPMTNDENKKLKDISPRELLAVAPLLLFIVWIGIHPSTFLSPIEAAVGLVLGY